MTNSELVEVMVAAMDSIPADARPSTVINADRARKALDALGTAGYAVVKLPEAIGNQLPDWGHGTKAFSGANTVYYVCGGEIESDAKETWSHTDDARDDAAALLAAANYAETEVEQ